MAPPDDAGQPAADVAATLRIGPRADDEDAGSPTEPGHARAPARGQRVGRFIVLRELGVGGMGVVVSAYDPKLERTVALKLMRPDVAPTEGATGARARLLREAQAMARLRHPNVVAVFEVGEYEGQVFLAMEYVPGTTLAEWATLRRGERRGQRQGQRPGWLRTLGAFVEAGRGLQAAHAQGLVHRDFKPSNVLVEGERVQVTDFGIASVGGSRSHGDATPEENPAFLGTAPYMAPELHAGEPADPRTDQFAFCVALYECLYGQRPFAGRDRAGWARSITEGSVLPPDDACGVPDWVHRALLRGLARDPAARWPSMGALLDTLASPDAVEVGRGARVAIGIALSAAFAILPFVAMTLGPPFDRSTHAGAVAQTLALLAMLLGLGWAARDLLRATAINRKAFLGVLAVLGMQLPLELGNAALGVAPVTSDIAHLVLWAAMAAMFAVTTDRRFLALAASYLACLPIAIAWPEHHLAVLGLSNAVLIAFVMIAWRRDAPLPRALGA